MIRALVAFLRKYKIYYDEPPCPFECAARMAWSFVDGTCAEPEGEQ